MNIENLIEFPYQNLLHFYTLIMNWEKEKLRKQTIYNCIKKNKISRNRFNHGGKRYAYWKEDIEEDTSVTTGMGLEGIMLSEITRTEKATTI